MSWNIKDLEDRFLIGSTLVEGSTLTEGEARDVLRGRTVTGHPVSESRELLNYRSAIVWLMREVEETPFVSANIMLEFHERLFQGFPSSRGRWKMRQNFTYRSDGSRYDYVKPGYVVERISSWLKRFNENPKEDLAAQVGAELYYEFQNIHPFEDGNGRIGRIFMAYWFHWKCEMSWSFYQRDKVEHLHALQAANDGNLQPLQAFFSERLKKEAK